MSNMQVVEYNNDIVDKTNRQSYFYQDRQVFDKPLVIRGSKKQYEPNQELVQFKSPNRAALLQFIQECNDRDNNLKLFTLPSLGVIKIVEVSDENILLSADFIQGGVLLTEYFYIETPMEGSRDKIAFKNFSNLLGVPYAYSKKTANSVNRINFEWWADQIKLNVESFPICILANKKCDDLVYTDSVKDTSGRNYTARKVHSVFKDRMKDKDEEVTEDYSVASRVPLFGRILENLDNTLQEHIHNSNIGLSSFTTGYGGLNEGRHFARLLFDNPDLAIKTHEGDDLHFGLNIETDFLGGNSYVQILPIVYRQICTNGMGISWSEETRQEIREQYIEFWLNKKGIETNDEEELNSYRSIIGKQFNTMTKKGLIIPVSTANLDITSSLIGDIVTFFLSHKESLVTDFAKLSQEFGDIDEQEFVEALLHQAKECGISCGELMKWTSIEYIAGNLAEDQRFLTPLDVVNFITYTCRAYESRVIQNVEQNALKLGFALYASFIAAKPEPKGHYVKYRGLVDEELI